MIRLNLKKHEFVAGFLIKKEEFELERVSIAVANSILERFFLEKDKVTPLKLQKLIYFVYKKYLQSTGSSMLTEYFEAWQYGPVLPSVYRAFKDYKHNPIEKYALINGDIYKIDSEDANFKAALNFVYGAYSSYTGEELVGMTHESGTAWHLAYHHEAGKRLYLEDEDIMSERWSFKTWKQN